MKFFIQLFIICLPLVLQAQLSSEDFESYNTGLFDSQSGANWTGWGGGSSGAEISAEEASSGTNSMKISFNDDIVALLGTLNSGVYEISFMQYISPGFGAYFNLQHNYTNSAGDWAVEMFFGNNVTSTQGSIVTDSVEYFFDDIVHGAWVENKIIADFDNTTAQYYYNGELIHTWAINTNSAGTNGSGLNQINAINFYGTCLDGGVFPPCNALAYYDEIRVIPLTVSTDNSTPGTYNMMLSPNPTIDQFTLDVNFPKAGQLDISI